MDDIGFKHIHVYLSDSNVSFENKPGYLQYLKTVVLGPYFKYIPSVDLKDRFVKEVLNLIEKDFPELKWNLDYVRLNISASK